jgi:hypothetical protein
MPHQLFKVIPPSYSSKVESLVSQLNEMIDVAQREEWLNLFNGGVPNEVLRWKGSLQEAYYLFNQIRIKTLAGESLVNIHTKNRGLDWVKINKVISTRYGKVQKESRANDLKILNSNLRFFIDANNTGLCK